MKEEGKLIIISSDYVKMELMEIEDEEKREDVMNFERVLSDLNFEHNNEVKLLASEIVEKCNIGILDALHISAAVLTNAEFFLTCDEGITVKRIRVTEVLRGKGQFINIFNPIDYLKSEWRIIIR
ncbi:MAG: PIN domain-containing protein [Candidatus Wukongarchaeota archaeon]|nr:PIN domain-containing protein [Candidatus Wukongarchaeota archaeon]